MALSQSISFKYNTSLAGTSFSTVQFENINKPASIKIK